MELNAIKPAINQSDLDFYLRLLDNKKIKTGGSDTTEQNHKLLDDMAWQAILRRHEND